MNTDKLMFHLEMDLMTVETETGRKYTGTTTHDGHTIVVNGWEQEDLWQCEVRVFRTGHPDTTDPNAYWVIHDNKVVARLGGISSGHDEETLGQTIRLLEITKLVQSKLLLAL